MSYIKQILLWLMGMFYVSAGVMHFVNTAFFVRIVPDYLPWHLALVYISGVCEIALGVLVLRSGTRAIAAWGIIALLIVVFPANVNMLVHHIPMQEGMPVNVPALWWRLPLQGVLIAWAWWYTRPMAAPSRGSS
jgi:uncharacterized membrane protein